MCVKTLESKLSLNHEHLTRRLTVEVVTMEAMSSQTNRMAMSWSERWASLAVRHNHVIMLFYIGNKLNANGVLRGDWITESGSKSSKSKLFSIRFVMIGRRYSSISCAFPRVSNSMRLTNLHWRLSKRDGEWIHQNLRSEPTRKPTQCCTVLWYMSGIVFHQFGEFWIGT